MPQASRPVAAARRPAITTFTLAGSGINALARAAVPLLLLAGRLRYAREPVDIAMLRTRLESEVRLFDSRVLQSGVFADHAQIARYALCAMLDEAVLGTAWGARSEWRTQSLVHMFHCELAGRDHFFQFLERMEREPRHHAALLESYYLCLSLGYEGTLADNPHRRQILDDIRRRLFGSIRALSGEIPRQLSDHWQGATGQRNRRWSTESAWMLPGRLLAWADERILHVTRRPARWQTPDATSLEGRFSEVIANASSHRAGGRRIRNLPWWIILGAPGSGKSSAIARSGLAFAAQPSRDGQQACHWWITDDAVLLDTTAHVEWTELLPMLKYHRRRIQGLVFACSASELLLQSDVDRVPGIDNGRRRVLEIGETLGSTLPLYLLITKMDLLPGFREYFDDLDASDLGQVWGVTFAIDDSRSGRALKTLPTEFDALAGRLHDRLTQRLQDEPEIRRRICLFEFPQQFARLKPAIINMARSIGDNAGRGQYPLVRGLYFTSASGPGEYVDAFHEFVGSPHRRTDHGPPRAFFIERLLREVVFRETGLSQ